jgi:hypothetical protein
MDEDVPQRPPLGELKPREQRSQNDQGPLEGPPSQAKRENYLESIFWILALVRSSAM